MVAQPTDTIQAPQAPEPTGDAGRPTEYTQETAQAILEAIAYSGADLTQTAQDNGVHRATVYRWCDAVSGFRDALQRARLLWCDSVAHRDSNRWEALAAKLEHDTRDARDKHVDIQLLRAHTEYDRWLQSKWSPTYRDKQDVSTTNRSIVLNVEIKAEAKQASQAIEQLLHPPQ